MHETSNVLRAFDSNKNIINVNTEVLRSIQLHHILSNHKSLGLFMQYLANEYSMECLLSLIEFIQYQSYIFEHIQRNFEYLNLTRERIETVLNQSNANIIRTVKEYENRLEEERQKRLNSSSLRKSIFSRIQSPKSLSRGRKNKFRDNHKIDNNNNNNNNNNHKIDKNDKNSRIDKRVRFSSVGNNKARIRSITIESPPNDQSSSGGSAGGSSSAGGGGAAGALKLNNVATFSISHGGKASMASVIEADGISDHAIQLRGGGGGEKRRSTISIVVPSTNTLTSTATRTTTPSPIHVTPANDHDHDGGGDTNDTNGDDDDDDDHDGSDGSMLPTLLLNLSDDHVSRENNSVDRGHPRASSKFSVSSLNNIYLIRDGAPEANIIHLVSPAPGDNNKNNKNKNKNEKENEKDKEKEKEKEKEKGNDGEEMSAQHLDLYDGDDDEEAKIHNRDHSGILIPLHAHVSNSSVIIRGSRSAGGGEGGGAREKEKNGENKEFTNDELIAQIRAKMVTMHRGIIFPQNNNAFPKSTIVYDNSGETLSLVYGIRQPGIALLKKKCYLLYKKYIAIGCQYEVNISSSLRKYYIISLNDLNCLLNNKNITELELFTMFTPCMNSMMSLMQGNFRRFKREAVFQKYLVDTNYDILNNNNNNNNSNNNNN